MLIGYARVSTADQTLDLQKDALEKQGCTRIFTDTASGAKAERTGLDQAFSHVRAGDTLVVWRLDRLGRSLKHLIETITGLNNRHIGSRASPRTSIPRHPEENSSSTSLAHLQNLNATLSGSEHKQALQLPEQGVEKAADQNHSQVKRLLLHKSFTTTKTTRFRRFAELSTFRELHCTATSKLNSWIYGSVSV